MSFILSKGGAYLRFSNSRVLFCFVISGYSKYMFLDGILSDYVTRPRLPFLEISQIIQASFNFNVFSLFPPRLFQNIAHNLMNYLIILRQNGRQKKNFKK